MAQTPVTYVALDLETTGLSPERDAILEIGLIKFAGQRVLGRFSSLINPARRIPYQITQLTGITLSDVQNAPLIREVLPKVREFIGDSTIIGHNVRFDMGFLTAAGLRLSNRTIDTFALASVVLLHVSGHSLGTLAAELGIQPSGAHRALDDAETARQLFLALCERAETLPLTVIQDINRAAVHSNWPLTALFRQLESRRSRTAFMGTLGAQLSDKGFGRLGLLIADRDDEELAAQPEVVSTDTEAMVSLLEPDGRLAQSLAGYEHRPQQVAMLRAVADALRDGEHLIVEAGTGTGKSLAYLIPAVHFAVANGSHVVISTNTINLQDQLYQKDIPDLQKALPFEFRATILKGRSNYVCLRKLHQAQQAGANTPAEMQTLAQVLVWAQSTATGDRAELFLPSAEDRAFFARLAADSDSCVGEECEHYARGTCFLQRARRRARASHLIIANHSLLLADVATDNAILPDYRYLIIDEAHHLEDATTKQLSYEVDFDAIMTELGLLVGLGGRGRGGGLVERVAAGVAPRLEPPARRELDGLHIGLLQDAGDLADGLRAFLTELADFTRDNSEGDSDYGARLRITDAARKQPAWSQIEINWDNLSALLTQFSQKLGRLNEILEYAAGQLNTDFGPDMQRDLLARKVFWDRLRVEMYAIISEPRANSVDWLEVPAGSEYATVHSAPLHVGELVKTFLLDRHDSVIMTSATLRAGADFSFLRGRLSIEDARELAVGSPFDFRKSTLLYLVTDVPEPGAPFYQESVAQAVDQVARGLGGRTLVLFTSYRQLRTTVQKIGAGLADAGITVLEQGNGPSRAQLLQQFRDGKSAVLFGTRSFWEGIDVMGPALSCVIIVRIPFAVPTEPIFAARAETFDHPFEDYSVPDAVLRFRQGFGRLIRSKTDRGAVVVLDRRLFTKQYGQTFIRALPPCTVERGSLDEVGARVARWVDGA